LTYERRQFALSCAGILFTLVMIGLTVRHFVDIAPRLSNPAEEFGLLIFAAIVLLLVSGGLIHQWARAGYFIRLARQKPMGRRFLEGIYQRVAPAPLAILIPSYKEELPVLKITILSAALLEYPDRQVVVLLDDPPSGPPEDVVALQQARWMIDTLDRRFASAARLFQDALKTWVERGAAGKRAPAAEHEILAGLYERAACELDIWASEYGRKAGDSFAHVVRFFLDNVLYRQANAHRTRAASIRENGCHDVGREYRRLASLFSVAITRFERKQYQNLSWAPNKAMNLNSYLGLMGLSFRTVESGSGLTLVPAPREQADLCPKGADYVLTLDADSVVLPDYAMKLVPILERDPRVAVIQTPYSAFPGAANHLERIAGATTDIQYILHQGFSAFRAGYWVGANALLRFRALNDIREEREERGHPVPVFIQDRTVIEDTGSTIDLIRRGWSVHNFMERLAYSATPPDFGSLVIQRQRWSNGGLLILPDLIRFCFGPKENRASLQEACIRIHYLISPACANFGLLILLLVPFDVRFAHWILPLTAIPYYFLYGLDLRLNGYRWADLARVYALNLLLVPVNLAGVIASLRQAVTGRKSPFRRTPKIEGRTATPPVFVAFHIAAMLYLLVSSVACMVLGRYVNGVFTAMNGAMLVYGFSVFIHAPEQPAPVQERQPVPAE